MWRWLPVWVASSLELRVCTTGDYPPLTFWSHGSYSGLDIELMKDFAKSNNFTVRLGQRGVRCQPSRWVATSWPSLSMDLEDRCDVAVGGITKTALRAERFATTWGYLKDRSLGSF